jgi:hypothetical protein
LGKVLDALLIRAASRRQVGAVASRMKAFYESQA